MLFILFYIYFWRGFNCISIKEINKNTSVHFIKPLVPFLNKSKYVVQCYILVLKHDIILFRVVHDLYQKGAAPLGQEEMMIWLMQQ